MKNETTKKSVVFYVLSIYIQRKEVPFGFRKGKVTSGHSTRCILNCQLHIKTDITAINKAYKMFKALQEKLARHNYLLCCKSKNGKC